LLRREDYDDIERVEAELDQFVLKRDRERRDANRVEELWAESARRDLARRRRENCALWYAHEMHLSAVHAALSEEHRMKAEALNGSGEEVA
jgi:hypothetical protein